MDHWQKEIQNVLDLESLIWIWITRIQSIMVQYRKILKLLCIENWLQIINRKYFISKAWEDNEIISGKPILPMEFSYPSDENELLNKT